MFSVSSTYLQVMIILSFLSKSTTEIDKVSDLKESKEEGFTKDSHKWVEGEGIQRLYEKYDHPMYKRLNKITEGSGHGGMDGMMVYRIIECLRNGKPLDQNVYEGCAWSSLIELTSNSVNQGGTPQEFPDFTRGKWVSTKPFNIKP